MENRGFYQSRDSQNRPVNKSSFQTILMFFVLIIGILIGFVFSKVDPYNLFSFKKPITTSGQKLDEIINLIDRYYVDTINDKQFSEQSLNEVLSQLDPHSVFIPAEDLQAVDEDLRGNFEGIGIEFYIIKDTISVVRTLPGGPSEKHGILAGDRIVKINDTIVAGKKISNEMVMKKLKGKGGTTVKVGISRKGLTGIKNLELKREKIPLYSVDVSYLINQSTGYIKISKFSSTTYDEFMTAAEGLKKSGATNLIIDLRENGGGYLETAVNILDELLSGKKLLLYTKGAHEKKTDYKCHIDGLFETGKLAVLIDENSASASEIVAGAIQDWDRGIIIGRRSFGKGLVQKEYELSDGSALRLTVSKYYIPSGRCIQKPYNKNMEDYYTEVYDRLSHGEFSSGDSIHNSDTTVYKTRGGRKVYGGGGITPDIFIPMDTFKNWAYLNDVRKFIPDYAYTHNDIFGKETFAYNAIDKFLNEYKVSDALYNDFLSYAVKNGLQQKQVLNIQIQSRVSLYIKAYIARQKWDSKGFYGVLYTDDPFILRATNELSK